MHASTTIAHAATKLAVVVAGSMFALPAATSGSASDLQTFDTMLAIHEPAAQGINANRPGIQPASRRAETPSTAAPRTPQAARKPAGYRCGAKSRCAPLSTDDRQRLLVLFALWKTLP